MGSIPGQGTKILYAIWPNTHTHTHIYIYINLVENCTIVLLVSNMVYFLYKTNACFNITSKQIGFLQKIIDASLNMTSWASSKKLQWQLNHNLRWRSIAKTATALSLLHSYLGCKGTTWSVRQPQNYSWMTLNMTCHPP